MPEVNRVNGREAYRRIRRGPDDGGAVAGGRSVSETKLEPLGHRCYTLWLTPPNAVP